MARQARCVKSRFVPARSGKAGKARFALFRLGLAGFGKVRLGAAGGACFAGARHGLERLGAAGKEGPVVERLCGAGLGTYMTGGFRRGSVGSGWMSFGTVCQARLGVESRREVRHVQARQFRCDMARLVVVGFGTVRLAWSG